MILKEEDRLMADRKTENKKYRNPEAENSARVRREAGVLFLLAALIPAAASLVTGLSSLRRKR